MTMHSRLVPTDPTLPGHTARVAGNWVIRGDFDAH